MRNPIFGLPTFDGKKSFARFTADYQTFAKMESWTADQQRTGLPLCLTGIARDAYDALTTAEKATLPTIYAALSSIFPADTPVSAHVKLRKLEFAPGDDLDSFVVTLRKWVSRSFPSQEKHDGLSDVFDNL